MQLSRLPRRDPETLDRPSHARAGRRGEQRGKGAGARANILEMFSLRELSLA